MSLSLLTCSPSPPNPPTPPLTGRPGQSQILLVWNSRFHPLFSTRPPLQGLKSCHSSPNSKSYSYLASTPLPPPFAGAIQLLSGMPFPLPGLAKAPLRGQGLA